MAYLSTFLN